MGIVRNNTLTEGLSGRVGDLVFKNYGSITVVTSRPRSPRTQSAQQQANRSKFKEATHWAKSVLLDPARKEYYQKKAKEMQLPNAYTAAITDYMRKPKQQVNERSNAIRYVVSKKGFELRPVEIILRAATEVNKETQAITKGGYGDWTFRPGLHIKPVSRADPSYRPG